MIELRQWKTVDGAIYEDQQQAIDHETLIAEGVRNSYHSLADFFDVLEDLEPPKATQYRKMLLDFSAHVDEFRNRPTKIIEYIPTEKWEKMSREEKEEIIRNMEEGTA